jgi:hypothetical protein
MAGENYQKKIKKLSQFISEFQRIKLVTSVFEFLDHTSSDDWGPTRKKQILETNFNNVWRFLNEYNNCIILLDEELKKDYFRSKRSESKKLADKLDKLIDGIDNQLEPAEVKERIRADYTEENLKEDVPFGGMTIKATKPYIWSEFKIEMLDTEYLFEDYFAMLYSLLETIRYVVEQFKAGYKNEKPVRITEVLIKRKHNSQLNEVIFPEKWGDFIQRCVFYSKERLFDADTLPAKVITRRGNDNFYWVGIGKSAIPPLGQFIKLLAENDFFVFDERMIICRSFLKFFHLPAEIENAKFLSKQVSKQKSDFADFFKLD